MGKNGSYSRGGVAGKPHPIDTHVGSRLRERRTELGLSQEKLGDAIGLTFQQVQKYERGANRVGASRLYDFSQILSVPVQYFFDEYKPSRGQLEEEAAPYHYAIGRGKRENLELYRALNDVTNDKVRKKLLDLIKVLVDEPEHAT